VGEVCAPWSNDNKDVCLRLDLTLACAALLTRVHWTSRITCGTNALPCAQHTLLRHVRRRISFPTPMQYTAVQQAPLDSARMRHVQFSGLSAKRGVFAAQRQLGIAEPALHICTLIMPGSPSAACGGMAVTRGSPSRVCTAAWPANSQSGPRLDTAIFCVFSVYGRERLGGSRSQQAFLEVAEEQHASHEEC
jgi:hypothetical protein